jgi:carbon storage regulator
MLVVSRKPNETIRCVVPPSTVERTIDIMVTELRGDKARIGIQAEREVTVDRLEVFESKVRDGVKSKR